MPCGLIARLAHGLFFEFVDIVLRNAHLGLLLRRTGSIEPLKNGYSPIKHNKQPNYSSPF